MAVVGIDFGSYSCFIAVARAGGIETIANEYSDRSTPTYVAFSEKQREMGAAAKQQAVTNVKNTLVGFKNLIGRKFKDPQVHQEIKWLHYRITEGPKGTTGIHVQYMGKDQVFTPEQVTAMMLTKLKQIAETALHMKVVDVVISVPCSLTDLQRRSMLEACQMAGLNCLRLMNDTLAVSLAYGIYKQDLPAENEKSRNIVFVDMGYTSFHASLCAFNKGKLKMLAVTTDHNLGGRNFDRCLIEHFAAEFKKKYKIDVMSNPKAVIRMGNDVEKLKKLMSTNTQKLPLNIECLMNDIDVHSSMDRATFDELTSTYLHHLKQKLESLLRDIKFSRNDVHSVEIVGGSSRVPSVKAVVKEVFGMEPRMTLNADEAVARGCALQCAILSPTFRVRDFSITDCQLYPLTLRWKGGLNEDSDMEIFPKFHAIPFAKMLTFFRKEPMTIDCKYSYPNDIPYPEHNIGSFSIGNIQPQPNGDSSKIKVKVKMNIHGIFSVSSASMVEKLPETETKPAEMDVDYGKTNGDLPVTTVESCHGESENTPDDQAMEADKSQPSPEGEKPKTDEPMNVDKETAEKTANTEEVKKEEKKSPKKKTVKTTDLPVECVIRELNRTELNNCIEKESQMVQQDKLEKDRQYAKNAVEEYIYEMRDRLYSTYEQYIMEQDREKFSRLLNDMENWLYEDGEDEKKEKYVARLQSMKDMGNPVVKRFEEARERPAAFEKLGSSLQRVRKVLDLAQTKDEKYDHLSDDDVTKLGKCLQDGMNWYETHLNIVKSLVPHQDPPILVSDIISQNTSLESSCNPIINKPKPKVEPPPEKKADTPTTDNANASATTTDPTNATTDQQGQGEGARETMEVD